MDKDSVKIKMEEVGIDQNKIDEFLESVKSENGENPNKKNENNLTKSLWEAELKKTIIMENDWKKKAALSALMISMNLE